MKKITFILIALLSTAIFAQDLPRIAVYVTGDAGDNEKRVLGTSILTAIVRNGRYTSVERANIFFAEVENERAKLVDGAIMDDNQIREIGKRFGAEYVCITDVTTALGEYHVSARVIDVETAAVVSIGESHGPMQTMSDLTQVADNVVRNTFGEQTRPDSQPNPAVDISAPSEISPAADTLQEAEAEAMAAFIQSGGTPNIAIYITSGGEGGMASRTITPLVANGLVKALSGGFSTANRTDDINNLLEHAQGGGLSGEQMREIASQLGIYYLCVTKISFGAGGSFGLEIELVNAMAGRTITSVNMANLNRNTIAKAMLDIGRELLMGLPREVAGTGMEQPQISQEKVRKIDGYFAARYMLPVTMGTGPLSLDLEGGMIWRNGWFWGVEAGISNNSSVHKGTVGAGFNWGYVQNFSDADLQIAYGVFTGFWSAMRESMQETDDWGRTVSVGFYARKFGVSGPFIRFRWHIVELSYKGIIGWYGYDSRGRDGDLALVNQFMLGVHFESSKRRR
jgi:hypothetical protein